MKDNGMSVCLSVCLLQRLHAGREDRQHSTGCYEFKDDRFEEVRNRVDEYNEIPLVFLFLYFVGTHDFTQELEIHSLRCTSTSEARILTIPV